MTAKPAPASRPPRRAATLAVQAGILLSRIAGLVRERAISHYLGLSPAAGAFAAALRIPNLLQTLFGEGALSASFIPVYKKLLAAGREEEAGRVAGIVASLLAVVVAALALLGSIFARPIIDVVAPGFEGDVRELTISLVAILFPGVALLALSAWCLAILNSHRRFFLSYVAPVLWNAAMIAALFAFGGARTSSRLAQMELARLLGWAALVGSGLQLGVMLPSALRLARHLRPSLSLSESAPAREVVRNFGPALLARGVVQISAYIDQALASFLGAAVTAAMAKAQVLYTLPVSLFGVAVSAAELPEMSGAIGTAEEVKAAVRARLEAGLRRIAFFVVPSAAAFLALGEVVAGLIFQTGKFSSGDARTVWLILAGSAAGLLAATQGRLLATAFWALGDTRTPLVFATVRVVLTGVSGYALALPVREALHLAPDWGGAALTASAGASAWLEYLLLRRALTARLGPFRVAGHAIARAWAAAILAAAAAFAARRFVPLGGPLPTGIVILGLYGGLYFAIAAGLGMEEGIAIFRRVRRLLRM